MKRKEPEKGGILGAIPLDLNKLTRLPAKIVVTHHHQKEVYESRDDNDVGSVLPYDMEAETLIRLPGKSLMKCLCVSKTWYSLIRSQRFVASYYAAKPSRFVVAFTNSADPRRLFILSGEDEETSSSSSSLVANLDMTIPSVILAGGYKYFSVHGFIACCFLYEFIVCNPSTGQVITFSCNERGTSLGYDPVGDKFKALTHLTSMCDHMHDPNLMLHEVITLGGGGGGVVSRTRFTSPYYRPFTSGLCINGFMYYGASAPSHTSNNITFPSILSASAWIEKGVHKSKSRGLAARCCGNNILLVLSDDEGSSTASDALKDKENISSSRCNVMAKRPKT